MLPQYVYNPGLFYGTTMAIAFLVGPLSLYVRAKGFSQLPLILLTLCTPCVMALIMIFGSGNSALVGDFLHRLFLFIMSPDYLGIILFLMPAVMILATAISLLFGGSLDQFSLTKQLSVMKGWACMGLLIPLLLAPLIEEIGWRGYGVDSLRAYCNLFTTSALFGVFWALWHLPAFFVKGYYQNQLWYQGKVYVLNFFLSVFVTAFIMNWIYFKTDRSIPVMVLFHASLNLSAMLLQTTQFTKCIATGILAIISLVIVLFDWMFFFSCA